jgi:hypothetical protein
VDTVDADGIEGFELLDEDEIAAADAGADGEADDAAADADADADAAALAEETAEEPVVLDPRSGQVVDTVDTTGDGFSDVTIYDSDGDGRGDFVEGDVNDDGIMDITLQDTDGDGVSDVTSGAENFELLSDIDTEDIEWINRDGPNLDSDRDGVTNVDEHDLGTDPVGGDSDLDGLADGSELAQGSNPLDWTSTEDAGQLAWGAELEAESAADAALGSVDVGSFDTLDTSSLDTSASFDTGASFDAGASLDTAIDTSSDI